MIQEIIQEQPVIEAERFVLRPLRRSDAGLIELYAGDERVARGTRRIPHPLPPGVTEAYIKRAADPNRIEDVWAIDASATGLGELLGLVTLEKMDRQQSEIGYWIAPAFWNTGIASETVRAMIEANPQGAKTYFAEVFQDNPISARVLTNAGFEFIGDAETHSVARGRMVPTWTYSRNLG